MSNLRLHLTEPKPALPLRAATPIGAHLIELGAISQADLDHVLRLQQHIDAPVGEILMAEGLASKHDVLRALAQQQNAQLVDLITDPPDRTLAPRIPSFLCLRFQVVPWTTIGDAILVATSAPHEFEELRTCIGPHGPQLLPVIADSSQIQQQISRLYGMELAEKAATRVPAAESCRTWEMNSVTRKVCAVLSLVLLLTALVEAPMWTLSLAILFAFATLVMSTLLKAMAFLAQLISRIPEGQAQFRLHVMPFRLPKVSVLVPLLNEKEIAGALIRRLSRLTYPKSLLDVVLVLEKGDIVTKETLARTALPPWISVIEVPEANQLTTKPRALNYALNFCKGSIIGVWDAEDAPEPDQIERVVTRFRTAPANVACLQGILDYYNSRSNWLSRCFTIEYAAWWRVLLPGVARLGLVIPLGGTTLFFRRDILEKLCGWDAHNVTEDADLGVRLARHGYVTELLPTVTYEEANCRAWPWVRQRSRWLKGFLITWAVHMREPARLHRELGPLRFWGLQTMLFATFCQFALAPLLWTFWLSLAGVPHPIEQTLGADVMWGMIVFFILAETLNLLISAVAVSGKNHRHLVPWVFTLPIYFTLGALAAYKGLLEFILRPFFWDKTQHGVTSQVDQIEGPSIPLQPSGLLLEAGHKRD